MNYCTKKIMLLEPTSLPPTRARRLQLYSTTLSSWKRESSKLKIYTRFCEYILYLFSILIFIYYSQNCFSLDSKLDDKIYINSDTLEVDYANGTAEYQTNVFVQKKGNFDLYCNRAKIFSVAKESSKKNISVYTGNIKHIELYDNITIVKGTKIAKGDFGIIYPKKKLIILTGKVKLKETTENQQSYLEGHEIKYYMDKEIFKISNNISQDNSQQGKVKIILNESKNKK